MLLLAKNKRFNILQNYWSKPPGTSGLRMWLKVSSKDNKPSLMLLGPSLHTSPDTISRYSCRVGFDFPFLTQNLELPSRLLPLLGGLLFWQREVVRPSTSTIAHFDLSSESCTVNKRDRTQLFSKKVKQMKQKQNKKTKKNKKN